MAVALVGVTVMIVLQVLFRYVLGAPLHYTEEVARYLTLWAAMLGAALGVRSGTHFSVRYLITLLPTRLARFVILGGQLLVAAFIVVFLVASSDLLSTAAVQASPAARIPLVWVYAAAPVGAGLMLFFTVTAAIAGRVRDLPTEVLPEEVR